MSLCTYVVINLALISSCICTSSPSILVIGAGPSGIAAATKLAKNNFTNVRILEAENRIGGRVHSVKFGDAYVDLGGEWCHGEKDNIVYNMVNKYEILRHTDSNIRLYYSNGKEIDSEIATNLYEFSESVDASQRSEDIEDSCKNLVSIGECYDKVFNTTFLKMYKNDPEKLQISLDADEWLQNFMIGYDSTFSLHDLVSESDYRRCEGDLLLNWNGRGYKTILEVMLQTFRTNATTLLEDGILLNKEVTKITWNNTKNLVECSDNSTFEADHIIFTPSLGVLKATHEQIFEPELPSEKVKAIKGQGFGAIMKVVLHFPTVWWNLNEHFGFIFNSEARRNAVTEYGKGPTKNGNSWLTSHVLLLPAENNPNVLISYLAGEVVQELEKESDKVIIEGYMYLFNKFLGSKFNIVAPDQIIRSTWYNNPHFRGTYSYESVKGNSKNSKYPDKLASPLTNEEGYPFVLFAGEATHPYYFSTVHGAIESGYREASRIIDFYNKKGI